MTQRTCICPQEIQSYGRLYGISMGRGPVRLSTVKGCPAHDSCHGFTAQVRAARPSRPVPYCPIHRTRNCPSVEVPCADPQDPQ